MTKLKLGRSPLKAKERGHLWGRKARNTLGVLSYCLWAPPSDHLEGSSIHIWGWAGEGLHTCQPLAQQPEAWQ